MVRYTQKATKQDIKKWEKKNKAFAEYLNFSTLHTMGRFSKQGLRKVKRILIYVFSFQGAWSKSDPEKGIRSAEDEEKETKRKALQNDISSIEAILEEEMEVEYR